MRRIDLDGSGSPIQIYVMLFELTSLLLRRGYYITWWSKRDCSGEKNVMLTLQSLACGSSMGKKKFNKIM